MIMRVIGRRGKIAERHIGTILGIFVDVNLAVLDREDLVRVVILAVFVKERVPAVQVLAVEQRDPAVAFGGRGWSSECREDDREGRDAEDE